MSGKFHLKNTPQKTYIALAYHQIGQDRSANGRGIYLLFRLCFLQRSKTYIGKVMHKTANKCAYVTYTTVLSSPPLKIMTKKKKFWRRCVQRYCILYMMIKMGPIYWSLISTSPFMFFENHILHSVWVYDIFSFIQCFARVLWNI